ncbi:FAD-binding oxidoreductase [Natronoglycomyces albus]|uniref:FAD-binding FR-type domain-containing protein n=1 Tax=Natronoglycomyces albus TaxID=2811108 RepID=A0A895XQA8_9ACTN|nr:FAD-binding oxidoreductase [Natronoglycomyces albus]QSB05723.1 hypothetical protein JQS30_01995 [Natronoglycomyces albus]
MSVTLSTSKRKRPESHKLSVISVENLTDTSVAVTLAVPPSLREIFDFQPGQYITFRSVEDSGREAHRSYSLCSTPADLHERGVLRVGVKSIPSGTFSAYASEELQPGDTLEVLPPLGTFTTQLRPDSHIGAVIAGSGVTPVLSITAATLQLGGRVTLLYSNRTADTVMFSADLAKLQEQHGERLRVLHVRTREDASHPLLTGRLDAEKMAGILREFIDVRDVDDWFLCGPFELVVGARESLTAHGAGRIHTELFYVE